MHMVLNEFNICVATVCWGSIVGRTRSKISKKKYESVECARRIQEGPKDSEGLQFLKYCLVSAQYSWKQFFIRLFSVTLLVIPNQEFLFQQLWYLYAIKNSAQAFLGIKTIEHLHFHIFILCIILLWKLLVTMPWQMSF